MPLLQDSYIAAKVLRSIKPDIKKIATGFLDDGFRIEFWDEPDNMRNDHNKASETYADIAIAYYDHQDNLNLSMIEHNLTEKVFTNCGRYKRRGKTSLHSCLSATAILKDPDLCYYHSSCNYRYWQVTNRKDAPFKSNLIQEYDLCPFKGGLNQLWRNQLLAFCVESSPNWPYKKVYFSIVFHPKNHSLEPAVSEYGKLIEHSERFFAFT